jgi:hypothetical protein
MYIFLDRAVQFIEHVSSICGQCLLSSYDCVITHPWVSIIAGILGYLAAMRTMCR